MWDQRQGFVFDNCELRGVIVRLDAALARNLNAHAYTAPVRDLLARTISAVAAISSTIKLEGRVSLQLQGGGALRLLLAEATHDGGLRGIARCEGDTGDADFRSLMDEGVLALNLIPDAGNPYQGIVPLDGADLASCLQHYFLQSEQLPSFLRIAVSGERAAALFIQALPQAQDKDVQRIQLLAQTLRDEELLQLDNVTVLTRLFHEEELRLFEPEALRFQCRCSREKSLATLRLLEPEELQQSLREQGEIAVNCEFCSELYRFDAIDVAALHAGAGSDGLH